MLKSIRIRSGCFSWQSLTACSPLVASKTPYPLARKTYLRISRLSSESSTTRMNVTSFDPKTTFAAQPSAASRNYIKRGYAFCEKSRRPERWAERGGAFNLEQVFSRKQSDFKGKPSPQSRA